MEEDQSSVPVEDDGQQILLDAMIMSMDAPLDGSFVAAEEVVTSDTSQTDNMDLNHNLVEVTYKGEFECGKCYKSYSTRSNLKRHEKVHADNEVFQCDKCTVILGSNEALKDHMALAHRETHLCNDCGKQFASRTNLNKHRRIQHTDSLNGLKNPTTCPVDGCNRSFIHKTKYQDHLCTHSGIKPHSCEICSKSFMNRYNRNRHQRACAGEIIIQCDFCNATLCDRTSLRRHKEAQHKHTTYDCVCGKKFKYESNLIRHKKIHSS